MLYKIQYFLQRLFGIQKLNRNLNESKILLGQMLNRQTLENKAQIIKDIKKAEFKVFSQWGDDGIIQFLIEYLDIKPKTFIEFGVEDYIESNTRFLLVNNNWSGLVLDGSKKNIEKIKADPIYWRHDLIAECAFITTENINEIIQRNGFNGHVGILSIDIDGNDYWVWEAIECVDPSIVIIEYNAVFGDKRSISVPYRPDFQRTSAHYSNLYFGASLPALVDLGAKKGYHFIGCTSSGNNAYFIRMGLERDLSIQSIDKGFVQSKSRESRDKSGNLTYHSGNARLDQIKGLEVIDVKNRQSQPL